MGWGEAEHIVHLNMSGLPIARAEKVFRCFRTAALQARGELAEDTAQSET